MITKVIQFFSAAVFIVVGAVASTYAIYKMSNDGTADLDVAKWNIKVLASSKEMKENTIIPLSNITWTNPLGNVAEGKIAPGSYTTFNILVDASGTETSVDYKVEIGDLSSLPFIVEVGNTTVPSEGTIDFSEEENAMKLTIPITIIWDGTVNDSNSKNTIDLSFKNKPLNIPITVITSQKL